MLTASRYVLQVRVSQRSEVFDLWDRLGRRRRMWPYQLQDGAHEGKGAYRGEKSSTD